MPNSPYKGKKVSEWSAITDELIAKHPMTTDEIVETVLNHGTIFLTQRLGHFQLGKKLNRIPK